MIIENGVLKSYDYVCRHDGRTVKRPELIDGGVFIPDGVKRIGGMKTEADVANPDFTSLDLLFYQLFRDHTSVRTVIMTDSVLEIGEKAFENCRNLKRLVLSKNVEWVGINALLGCRIDEISYNNTIDNFLKISLESWCENCGVVHCSDGDIDFRKKIYIEKYNYSGTKSEWNESMASHWLNRRTKVIHCSDGDIVH